MKMRFLYSILLVLSGAGFAVWHFWNPFSSVEKPSIEIAEAHQHSHIDEHGHHEENIITLTADQIAELGIQTTVAAPGELSVLLSTRGKIVLNPDKLVHILPKISGVAVEARKNIGDAVVEGEILAVLESREMADIKANYLAAKEKESLALSLLEREQRLYEKKVSAGQDYINAKSAYAEARINFQLAKQKLQAFGIDDKDIHGLATENDPNLRLYDIIAPMNGVVIARHINRGEFIENTTTIYEIADLSTVWIEIGIYPKDLVKVKEGQIVDISLPVDGESAQAKIIYLSPIIQDETITAKAIAELKNASGNWRPGSFVRVSIATGNSYVPLLISREAIQEIDGKSYIFIKVPEGFEKREVQLGAGDNGNVEILSGLSAGEEYASSKTFILKADLSKEEAEHEH